MDFYPHNLTDMKLDDLEAVRMEWKTQAQEVVIGLIPALLVGWKANSAREYGREFQTVLQDALKINSSIRPLYFDSVKADYKYRMWIAISFMGERVANLWYELYPNLDLSEGNWSNTDQSFARPHSKQTGWLDIINDLVQEWQAHCAKGEELIQQKRKEALLKLLQEGEY